MGNFMHAEPEGQIARRSRKVGSVSVNGKARKLLSASLMALVTPAALVPLTGSAEGRTANVAGTQPATSAAEFAIAGSSQDSFDTMVLNAVHDQASLDSAKAVLDGMIGTVKAGRALSVPDSLLVAGDSLDGSSNQVVANLQTLESRLQTAAFSKRSVGIHLRASATVDAANAPVSGGPVAAASAPVSGGPINNNHTWQFWIGLFAYSCDGNGCVTTDNLNSRWTIDPGQSSDRYSWQGSYSHTGAALFQDIFYTATAFCGSTGGNVCSTQEPNFIIGSFQRTLNHVNDGGYLHLNTGEINAWFVPHGQEATNSASTNLCQMGSGSTKYCTY